ncbi:MAG: hypothetical protein J6S00_02630, partial [Clostridia bacterium]|nr:hypothetical protein [Clostridia bacterium]
MIILRNVSVPLNTDFSDVKGIVASSLRVNLKQIKSAKLYRKSVDARHKTSVNFCCSFLAELLADEDKIIKKNANAELYKEQKYVNLKCASNNRPIVVGFGPAGMFAALTLVRAGLKPIVIERGWDVDTSMSDIEKFFGCCQLCTVSNVQFGDGGAGTFSDGKLNTGIKDVRCRHVLNTFCEFGAPDKILYDAKPHIGTDILRVIVKNIRE